MQAVYHELRDATGTPDFTGYYDELELFGMRAFRELVELGRTVGLAETVEHPHQLPLFEDDELVEA